MQTTYYTDGLLRQASAAECRKYLGIESPTSGGTVDLDESVVHLGYIVQRTPLWQDVRIPLASTRPAANAPQADPFIGNTRAYRWDNAGLVRSLEWELQAPHGFNEAAAYGLRLHLHWTCASNMTGLGVVEWNVETVVADINTTFPGATTTYTATGATTAAYQHVITPLHAFTGLHDSAIIVGRLYRSIAGGDTYAGNDVFGLSLDAHYVVEQTGSLDEVGD